MRITHPTGIFKASISLPSSKSESNRLLILDALSGFQSELSNLAEANDTILLQKLLHSNDKVLDVEDAGTTMRFLTAYCCVTQRDTILKGSDRMHNRPIGPLVNALRDIGFSIEYLGDENYPPLNIKAVDPKGIKSVVSIPGDISSQFISALMMIAPALEGGLTIKINNKLNSAPYVAMTFDHMKKFGANGKWLDNEIRIEPGKLKAIKHTVESDWSAASYWYSIAALANDAEFFLSGLKKESFQGDSRISELMKLYNVSTSFEKDGARIKKIGSENLCLNNTIDFADTPDLAPTIIALEAAIQSGVKISGVESLMIKESNRIEAMGEALDRLGAQLNEVEKGVYMTSGELISNENAIDTYSDHRIAMSIAPLGLIVPVTIQNPSVVNKSYPSFWDHLLITGFEIFPTR